MNFYVLMNYVLHCLSLKIIFITLFIHEAFSACSLFSLSYKRPSLHQSFSQPLHHLISGAFSEDLFIAPRIFPDFLFQFHLVSAFCFCFVLSLNLYFPICSRPFSSSFISLRQSIVRPSRQKRIDRISLFFMLLLDICLRRPSALIPP